MEYAVIAIELLVLVLNIFSKTSHKGGFKNCFHNIMG